jgi:hypothetical protein
MQGIEITRFESTSDAATEVLAPTVSSPYSLKLQGRVDGQPRRVRVVAVEPLRRTLVATAPNTSTPGGFSTAVSLLGVPADFTLEVEAAFEDSTPATIARIEGRRPALRTDHRPRFAPVLLKTLGRAGSTWVTHLIGAHPQALAYRPFDYEPRVLDYWMEILRTLAQPYSYAQAIDPDVDEGRGWFVGRRRSLGPVDLSADPAVESFMETRAVEELAAFAMQRVDSFYDAVAASQQRPAASHFVERAHEWHELLLVRELYAGARVIVLVRDMRDLLASRIAFNRKRGVFQFGMDASTSTADYVRETMRREIDDLHETWGALGGDATLLRYEDLIREPLATARRLFEDIGMPADDRTVQDVLAQARDSRPERQAGHKTTSGGDEASIGRWQDDLEPALQDACAEAFAVPLEAFGYEAGTRRAG